LGLTAGYPGGGWELLINFLGYAGLEGPTEKLVTEAMVLHQDTWILFTFPSSAKCNPLQGVMSGNTLQAFRRA